MHWATFKSGNHIVEIKQLFPNLDDLKRGFANSGQQLGFGASMTVYLHGIELHFMALPTQI